MASENEASIWVSSAPIALRKTPLSRCSSQHQARSPDRSITASASFSRNLSRKQAHAPPSDASASTDSSKLSSRSTSNRVLLYTTASNHVSEQISYRWRPAASRWCSDLGLKKLKKRLIHPSFKGLRLTPSPDVHCCTDERRRGEAVRFVLARNQKRQRRRLGSDPSPRFTACDRRGVRSVGT